MAESFDFDQEVSRAHLDAAGWDVDVFKHSNPFLCHVIYIRDYRTDHVALFSITMKDFEALSPPAPPGELSALLARLLKRYQKGRLSPREERGFLPVLAGYVKGTQTYRFWRDEAARDARLHAVINVYPDGSQARLRPFALRESGTVVPAGRLMDAADEVREMDLRHHPEWFSG